VFAPFESGPHRDLQVSGHRRVPPLHAFAALVVAGLVIAACSSAAPSPTTHPSAAPSSPPSAASSGPPASAPSTPAATAALSGSPAACVDVGALADQGDPVQTAVQAIKQALADKKSDDARTNAQAAIAGMKSMADLVAPASPQGKALFLKAADELTQAAAQFPAGSALFDQAQADLDQAFTVARSSACSS